MLSARKTTVDRYLYTIVDYLPTKDPNTLTLIGSIPSLLFFVFVIAHWYVAALIVFLGNAFDLLDGTMARKYHKVTPFGGFLDSFMDRVSDFLVITAFAFAHIVRWEIAAPVLLFAFLTSYARSRGELAANKKITFAVGLIERTERFILLFIALLVYTLLPFVTMFGLNMAEIFFIFIGALSLYTLYERIQLAYRSL
jgi:phosphatidylglycerophosphate synthase